jgi:hypothetical protein
MLVQLQKQWRSILILVCIWLTFECLISWAAFCDSGNLQSAGQDHLSCVFRGPVAVFVRRFLVWWQRTFHEADAYVALFTCVLAASTIALWFSTNKLWQATRIASEHIPNIERGYIVGGGPTRRTDRDGKLLDDPDVGWVSIGNYGKTPAILKRVEWGFCDENFFPKERPVSEILNKKLLPKDVIDAIRCQDREDVLKSEDPPRPVADSKFSIKENDGKIFFGRFTYAILFDRNEHFSTFKLKLGPGAKSVGLPGSYTDWS